MRSSSTKVAGVVGLSAPTVTARSWVVILLEAADPRDRAESGVLPPETAQHIAATRHAGGRIVAVGTTTTFRLLESAATEDGKVRPFAGEARLFILPGHPFGAIDILLTNFHLPRSILFMLVAALARLGRIQAAYAHAVAAGYRFFSYGNACLIERH